MSNKASFKTDFDNIWESQLEISCKHSIISSKYIMNCLSYLMNTKKPKKIAHDRIYRWQLSNTINLLKIHINKCKSNDWFLYEMQY